MRVLGGLVSRALSIDGRKPGRRRRRRQEPSPRRSQGGRLPSAVRTLSAPGHRDLRSWQPDRRVRFERWRADRRTDRALPPQRTSGPPASLCNRTKAMSYQSLGFRREWAAAHLARRKPASPATHTSTTCSTPPTRALSCRVVWSREANRVPRRFAAPRRSQPSNRTLAPAGAVSRSARSSKRTTAAGDKPSALQRHTYSPSGSNSAFRSARSRRLALAAPQAISKSTCTSTSVVPACWKLLPEQSSSGTSPPRTTNSGRAP